eukprot:6172590-Pleurochrysis_carterae.AAC.2
MDALTKAADHEGLLKSYVWDCEVRRRWRYARASRFACGGARLTEAVSYTHLRAHETDSYL